MTIRVVIIDDQALMRDAFTMLLDAQPDLEVVGNADDGRSGVELCHRTNPDVALMDIRMPARAHNTTAVAMAAVHLHTTPQP